MRLPEKFVENMKELLKGESEKFFDALNDKSVKSLRVDANKINIDDFIKSTDLELEKISYLNNAFYYEGRVGQELLHHAGAIYSQDVSAMLPVYALDIRNGDIVLDVCSAPGGKSTQILEKLNGSGLLISNEVVYNRAKVLYENITRFGYNNFVITNNMLNDFAKKVRVFDKILVDAPCSGEGMFRKEDIDTYHWNEKDVEACAVRQLEILNSVSKCLKPNGILVYSTCTYNEKENERVVVEFLKNNKDFTLVELPQVVRENTSRGIIVDGVYDTTLCGRRYPHLFKGEGQFVAKFMKISEEDDREYSKTVVDKYYQVGRKEHQEIERYLKNDIDLTGLNLYKKGDNVYVAPNTNFDYSNLNVVCFGVCMGTIENKDFKLNHSFYKSYSSRFKNVIELTKEQAKIYISGNVVDNINIETSKESNRVCVVKYLGIPLGGGKIVGSTLKNYYPKNLRE